MEGGKVTGTILFWILFTVFRTTARELDSHTVRQKGPLQPNLHSVDDMLPASGQNQISFEEK